jgi:hypothetical protein
MSTRFNKHKATDFGLVELESMVSAIDPADKSIWMRCPLYDFGWGDENGYYRMPLPNYDELLQMVLHSKQEDDVYGAAAIILNQYPDELLETCEQMSLCPSVREDFMKLASVFHLHLGFNHSPEIGKTVTEIQKDAQRWRNIAYSVTAKKKTRSIWKFLRK